MRLSLEKKERKKVWEDKKSILSSILAKKPEEVMEIVNGAASLALMGRSTALLTTKSILTKSVSTE